MTKLPLRAASVRSFNPYRGKGPRQAARTPLTPSVAGVQDVGEQEREREEMYRAAIEAIAVQEKEEEEVRQQILSEIAKGTFEDSEEMWYSKYA